MLSIHLRVFLAVCFTPSVFCVVYEYYSGAAASKEKIHYYKQKGIVDVCTIDITQCFSNQYRRIDGSCNNMEMPARSCYLAPLARVLPAVFYNGTNSRRGIDGNELALPRVARVQLLNEGKAANMDFTQAMPSYGIFMYGDVGSGHDTLVFLRNIRHCCEKEGKDDVMCAPNIIPEDDPVHRFSGIRCMNLTRPLTHQNIGCTSDRDPSPVQFATKIFDLSQIYNLENKGDKVLRSHSRGKLKIEVEDSKVWPPTGPGYCPMNQPGETMCFGNYPNSILPINLFAVWFVRNHNFIASLLGEENPCWNDEVLFQVTRDINIAIAMQIYLYEWMSQLQGRENLIRSGIITRHTGFRDVYEKKRYPYVTIEYTYILRWFHTVQESNAKMYDEGGEFIRDISMLDLTLRTGFLAKQNHMTYLTQGQFRQPAAAIDYLVDYDMAENGLPGLQKAVDVATSDLHKGRLLGISPYVDYVFFCTGIEINTFEDLKEFMLEERIEQLRHVYKNVRDIDLLAGAWNEKPMRGGKIPPIVACLLNDNILNAIKGDRHWYERPNRPHAFTFEQLLEIRKASLAMLLCNVGDHVTKIQRHAFLTISDENPLLKCSEIPQIDFSVWEDPQCRSRAKNLP
ncbi:peroxidase-like [Anticarsia gemmatalis]|uniref:peroxidase-like n=1 Tax=Anticarsia gemmatalis TaxID=129554 RepID=UPI003F75C858